MSGKRNYRRPFAVKEEHAERGYREAQRYSTRPALYPDGTPAVALYSNGNVTAVLPEETAELLIRHLTSSLQRAKDGTYE